MLPTGLSTAGAVITPTIPLQRTMESSLSNANTDAAHSKLSTAANIFFICLVLLFETPVLTFMAYRLLGQRTGRKEGWHDVAVTISVQFW
jgi:hypothetical protein